MAGRWIAACALAVAVTAPVRLLGQESLTVAHELYASAEYEDALEMLDSLLAADPPPQERQAIELYRVFCLVAVGNTNEANSAIDAMIMREPLYRPNLDEMPPRLRNAFSDARKRLLPSIIQQQYRDGKAAFDQKDFKLASETFTHVLAALADPDIAPVVDQPPLADLRVLVAGFHDLTLKAMAPPAPAPAPAAAPVPPSPEPAPAPVAVAQPAPADAARIYTADDANIVQPVTVRQEVPPFPGTLIAERSGILEVIIDQTGAVESAVMREPLEPIYNRLLLTAAKSWAYRPARLDGVPVKFRKAIQITVSPNR